MQVRAQGNRTQIIEEKYSKEKKRGIQRLVVSVKNSASNTDINQILAEHGLSDDLMIKRVFEEVERQRVVEARAKLNDALDAIKRANFSEHETLELERLFNAEAKRLQRKRNRNESTSTNLSIF